MKKQILKTLVILVAAISLSGCANTFRGFGEDVSDVGSGIADTARDAKDWSHGKETALGDKIGEVPRGYAQPHYYNKSRRLTGPVMPPDSAPAAVVQQQEKYVRPVPEAVKQEPLPQTTSKSTPPPAAESRQWTGDPLPLQPSATRHVSSLPPVESGSGVIVNYDVLDDAAGTAGYEQQMPMEQPAIQYAPGVLVYPVDPGEWQPIGGPVSSNSYSMPQVLVSSNGTMQFDDPASSYNSWGGTADVPRETIFFNHGSARLGSGDKKALASLASESTSDPVYMVQVIGHASSRVAEGLDPVKQSAVNLQMSMLRAQAVTTQLYKDGIEPELVEAVARGDTQPNHNPPSGMAQEAANRRVEVFVSR